MAQILCAAPQPHLLLVLGRVTFLQRHFIFEFCGGTIHAPWAELKLLPSCHSLKMESWGRGSILLIFDLNTQLPHCSETLKYLIKRSELTFSFCLHPKQPLQQSEALERNPETSKMIQNPQMKPWYNIWVTHGFYMGTSELSHPPFAEESRVQDTLIYNGNVKIWIAKALLEWHPVALEVFLLVKQRNLVLFEQQQLCQHFCPGSGRWPGHLNSPD